MIFGSCGESVGDKMKMKHSPIDSIPDDIRMTTVLEPLKRGNILVLMNLKGDYLYLFLLILGRN